MNFAYIDKEICRGNVVKSQSRDELTTDVCLTLDRDSWIADVHIYKADKQWNGQDSNQN